MIYEIYQSLKIRIDFSFFIKIFLKILSYDEIVFSQVNNNKRVDCELNQ